jgi:hypothetical protein
VSDHERQTGPKLHGKEHSTHTRAG